MIKYIFLLLISVNSYSQDLRGKVVHMADGDTFTLLTKENKTIRIRLAEIDTPESGQPFGTKAKQALSALIFSKQVLAIQEDIDRYGRIVAHVYLNDLYINREMVKEGMAWVYREYNKDKSLLLDEAEAKEAKKGLWSHPSNETRPPWEWRKAKATTVSNQNKPTSSSSKSNTGQKYNCGEKRTCSQMSSCEEARYYLNNCGVASLDGDKDGIPCEALCK